MVMQHIKIDGRVHVVHGVTSERGGWMHVAVAPVDDRPHLVHRNVSLPSDWLAGVGAIVTSGHRFEHVKGDRLQYRRSLGLPDLGLDEATASQGE
jgi:hypothetical protein